MQSESRRLNVVGEREPSPPPIYDPLGDEAGVLVLRSSRLSAADKLAWGYLRVRSDSGRKQINVHPRDLAEHQGVTSDAGRQRLKNLKEVGLVLANHICRKTGTWTIAVLDPRDVFTKDVRFVPADPQRVLPFGELPSSHPADQAPSESHATAVAGDAPSWSAQTEAPRETILSPAVPSYTGPPRLVAEEPSEEPPEEPRRGTSSVARAPSGPSGLSGLSVPDPLYRPLTFGRPSEPSLESIPSEALRTEEPRRGTSGRSSGDDDPLAAAIAQRRRELGLPADGSPDRAAADDMALRTAAAIGAATAWRVPSPAEQARWREQWIDTIKRRVSCPRLKVCVAVKVASAIIAGEIKASQIEEVFAELDKVRRAGVLRAPASAYFVAAVKRIFARHGLDWTGYAYGGRRAPKPR